MSSQVLDKPGRNLYRVLRRARHAWWSKVAQLVSWVAVAAGAATVVSLWVAAWAHGTPGSLVGDASRAAALWVSVVTVSAAALAIGLVTAVLAAPSRLALARSLDAALNQAQRLSTTYEVLETGGPSTAVTLSLVEDVEVRSPGLDARRTGQTRAHGTVRSAALGLVLLGIAAAVLPVPARSPRDTLAATTAPAAGEPAAAHAATVTELAEILHLAAERSQSTYLRAVADSFTELSDRLASGTVSETEAERTSQELAQHLLAAAREVGGAFQQAIESSLADGAVADDSGVVLDPAASDSAEASLNQAGAATAAQSVGVAATEAVPSIYMAFDKVIAEYEYDPISLGLRPPGAELSSSRVESDIYGGVLTAQTDPNAPAPEAPFAGRVQGEGGGDVAGAAERSSDGAGDAAGAGGAELSAAPAIADGPVDTAVAALPQNERTDGRFAEVELLPDVPDGSVAVPLTLGAGQTFVRAAESSSAARGIGGTYRDVVARYFTPAAGSPGATE